jgi:hypothetical protein
MQKLVRFQDSGPKVQELQLALRKLGFSPGPIDGKFGFLTEEALLAFQRTYGLKQDGIAGQKVWELLAQRELPLLQFPLELTKDQSIEGIEAKYQLAAGSLRAVNRVGRKYPGGRIYIPQRKVLALWDPKLEPNAKARGEITSIALWGWQLGERLLWTGKEELLSQDVSCLAALTLNWELLAEKKIWPKRIEAIRLGLERHGQKGLLLEINEGEGRLRRRLADFVSRLASELSGRNLWLYLKLPARKEEDPKKDRNWSLDFRALGEAAHFVVLDLSQAEEGCSFREYLEAATGYARSVLPAWKIILYCPDSCRAGSLPLSSRERDLLAKTVLLERLAGIAVNLGKMPKRNYFVVEKP